MAGSSGIYEMDVINAVCSYLQSRGYNIRRRVKKVTDKGNDIEAIAPDYTELYIEAKGSTSSQKGSARYGKEFNNNQKTDHVAKAVLKALSYVSTKKLGGIALPDDHVHQEIVKEVESVLKQVGIRVFFVDPVGKERVREF